MMAVKIRPVVRGEVPDGPPTQTFYCVYRSGGQTTGALRNFKDGLPFTLSVSLFFASQGLRKDVKKING
jgi:hypothetical protein